ncbi:MAG: class I adenylate-forming enzyme family protein [Candidatus Hadarchaeales archaeon]
MEVQTLSQLPRRAAEEFGDKPFLLYPSLLTFRQLDEESDKVASGLAELGVGKGDRVALYLWNRPEFVYALFGILKAGAIAVPIDPAFREREVRTLLTDSGAKAIFLEEATSTVVQNVKEELPELVHLISVTGEGGTTSLKELEKPSPPPSVQPSPDDPAVIMYAARERGYLGAVLTHANLLSVIRRLATPELSFGKPEDRVALLHLMYSVFSLDELFLSLYLGNSVVLEKSFDIEVFLSHVEQLWVSKVLLPMTNIMLLTDLPNVITKYDLSSLRFVCNVEEAYNREVAEEFQTLTGVPVINSYGLAEASGFVNLPRVGGETPPGSLGPALGVEEKVVDEQGREVEPGKVGELVVRGPQVMKGYWNKPEETARVLKDGWLHTGDLATMDSGGNLELVGRKKRMIKFRGFGISPEEVEGVLKEHEAVMDAVVAGKPGLAGGEIPVAFVALKQGMKTTAGELMRWVEERLAPFKRVREVEFVPLIPRDRLQEFIQRMTSRRRR